MDVVDLDGDKAPEILYVARTKPGGDAYELRALTRDKSGSLQPRKWGEVDSVPLAGLTTVPTAVKTVDVNHDGQADLLIFKDYGSPLLLLGEKGGPPRPSPAVWDPSRASLPPGWPS